MERLNLLKGEQNSKAWSSSVGSFIFRFLLAAGSASTRTMSNTLDDKKVELYDGERGTEQLETPSNSTNPADPSREVSSSRQRISDIFTIICAGFALISDGYQNNLMTMTNVVLRKEYPKEYTAYYSTAVSNALLVGEIIGQVTIGMLHSAAAHSN